MDALVNVPSIVKCLFFHLQLYGPSNCKSQPLLCNHWDGLLNADPKLQNAILVITHPKVMRTRKQCILNMTEEPVCSQLKKTPVITATVPTMAVRRASKLWDAVSGSLGLNPAGNSQLRSLGRLSVPKVTHGGPAWNSRTTLRRANARTSLKVLLSRRSLKNKRLPELSNPSWTTKPCCWWQDDQLPEPRNNSTQS